jgi:hypothetical protein
MKSVICLIGWLVVVLLVNLLIHHYGLLYKLDQSEINLLAGINGCINALFWINIWFSIE